MIILALFIFTPLALGLAGWALSRVHPLFSRWFTLPGNAVDLVMVGLIWGANAGISLPSRAQAVDGRRMADESLRWTWVPSLEHFVLSDSSGFPLTLMGLTAFLGIMSVLASWKSIQDRVGFFHLQPLLVLARVNGVFLATDLFLFAFFWELMLVPMYFLD